MLEAFRTFFKIGLVTFGGGYAMIPLIEQEVVNKHQWVKKEELLDLIAIAQSCPGVFAINISTFIGYKLQKKRGEHDEEVFKLRNDLCIIYDHYY